MLLWGGGGGGGKDDDGGGGGAGSNCGFTFLPLTELGATETITIGQGGAGKSGGDETVVMERTQHLAVM